MPDFTALILHVMEVERINRILLGGVEFWVDDCGPWKGQLAYDKPSDQWDADAIAAALTLRLRLMNA